MNVYINSNVRSTFAALSDLLRRKEYAEAAERGQPLEPAVPSRAVHYD